MTSQIPAPKFKIGDKVKWARNGPNRRYYEGRYLSSLAQKGASGPGIEQVKAFLRKRRAAEVIGVLAASFYNRDSLEFNESYIGGNEGFSSPVYFEYQLLFRFQVGKNRLAMFTGIPVASESDLELIQDAPNPT